MTITTKERAAFATLDEWNDDYSGEPAGRIEKGVAVEYVAHVPGGMVKVRHNGQVVIMHPLSFAELS